MENLRKEFIELLRRIYKNPTNTKTVGEGLFVSSMKIISIDVMKDSTYYNISDEFDINEVKAVLVKNQMNEESLYIVLKHLENFKHENEVLTISIEGKEYSIPTLA